MRLFLLLFLSLGCIVNAQDPLRFQEEVTAIQKKYDTLLDGSRKTVVFTGSSSVRIWHNLQELFPNHQIVNSGFGGSQASDLLAYLEELVLNYHPQKVFIYEGDNDISFEKKPKEIIKDTREIIKKIKNQNPNTAIVLIAAKPSMARWHLKRSYKNLNRKFRRLSKRDAKISYANVWDTMIQGRTVRNDIFIDDGLHMNSQGYDLWYDVIKEYMN